MARLKLSRKSTACILLSIPLALPTLFVLHSDSTVVQADAQELGPKQSYLSGSRPADAPRSSAAVAPINEPAKPSSKMGFVPASPAPRNTPTGRPQVVNPTARRTTPQPPKYAVSAGSVPEAPPAQSPNARAIVARPVKPQLRAVASQPPAPTPILPPELPVEITAPQPEPAVAEIRQPAGRTLEEPAAKFLPEEPEAEITPNRGTVQLFFDDEPVAGDTEEMLEFGEPNPSGSMSNEIRQVAGQDDAVPAAKAQEVVGTDKASEARRKELSEILAELKPVRQVKLSDAIRLPKLGDGEKNQIQVPEDQAFALLSQRKPLHFRPIARDPWLANRDSYPFLHKPLWFEDPNLERCGRGWGPFTTVSSVVHFSANIPILPYRMSAESQCRCVPTLPDCTVCEKFGCDAYLPPWSWSAAAVQAAATVGFIYVIP